MNYLLRGHDRDNAVHDLLICLLPDEKHERVFDRTDGDFCLSELETAEDGSLVCRAFVTRGGEGSSGECRRLPENSETGEWRRAAGYAVKTALFHALVPLLQRTPVWGSLTGVKPAKPARAAIEGGLPRERAAGFLMGEYFVEQSRAKLCADAACFAIDAENSLAPGEVEVYVGIPFCPSRCAYCSFVSSDTARSGHLVEPYFSALLREIESAGEGAKSRKIGSLYIGGGTPTVLSAGQLDELLWALKTAFDLGNCREITVEAGRPDTLAADKLGVFSRRGVSRVSINPQSMDDEVLRRVGRLHSAKCTVEAFKLARELGDFAINMDLIAGLPGDSAEGFLDSLRETVELGPENVTVHSLARKNGADMRDGLRGDLEVDTLDKAYKMLEEAGFLPYYLYRQKYSAGGLENVGFCKPGFESHYNICMMEELCDVLALGAGGVSKICAGGGGKIERAANPKFPREYIERIDGICAGKLRLFSKG